MKKKDYYLGKTIGKLRGQIYRQQRHRYVKASVQLTVEEAILLNMVNERTNQITFTADNKAEDLKRLRSGMNVICEVKY